MSYPPPGGTPDPYGYGSNPDPYGQQPASGQPDPYGQQPASGQPDPYSQGYPQQQPDPYATSGPPYQQPGYPQQPYQQPQYGQQPYPGQYQQPGATGTNTMAVLSLVLSLVGLVTGVTAIAGVILGHIAKKQIRQTGEQGDGMATAGLVIGYVLVGLYALLCCGWLVVVIGAGTSGTA